MSSAVFDVQYRAPNSHHYQYAFQHQGKLIIFQTWNIKKTIFCKMRNWSVLFIDITLAAIPFAIKEQAPEIRCSTKSIFLWNRSVAAVSWVVHRADWANVNASVGAKPSRQQSKIPSFAAKIYSQPSGGGQTCSSLKYEGRRTSDALFLNHGGMSSRREKLGESAAAAVRIHRNLCTIISLLNPATGAGCCPRRAAAVCSSI